MVIYLQYVLMKLELSGPGILSGLLNFSFLLRNVYRGLGKMLKPFFICLFDVTIKKAGIFRKDPGAGNNYPACPFTL